MFLGGDKKFKGIKKAFGPRRAAGSTAPALILYIVCFTIFSLYSPLAPAYILPQSTETEFAKTGRLQFPAQVVAKNEWVTLHKVGPSSFFLKTKVKQLDYNFVFLSRLLYARVKGTNLHDFS